MPVARDIDTLPDPGTLKIAPWWIRGWTNDERAALDDDVLTTTMIPRTVGMDSGTGFFASPEDLFPATAARVSYEVFFDKDYTWVKGGKLGFGLGIGDALKTATGGDWAQRAGSVRVMWREDGQAIGYMYLPLENRGRDTVIRTQSLDFLKATKGSIGERTGIKLFHKDDGARLQFKKNAWNTVEWDLRMNDVGKKNGKLSLTINGVTRRLDGVVFRKSGDIRFNGVIFHSFFGGSTLDWACKTQQHLAFRKIKIETHN